MYMYVCMYVCIYIYIYTHANLYGSPLSRRRKALAASSSLILGRSALVFDNLLWRENPLVFDNCQTTI